MAFNILSACGGYGQLGFIGQEGGIIADAASLSVVASGSTSVEIASNAACAMIGQNIMIGISSPNAANGNCFGWMVNNGTFSTFDLPSSFPLTQTGFQFGPCSQNGDIAPANAWFCAWSNAENGGYPYFLNLGVLAGLATGADFISVPFFEYSSDFPGSYYSNGVLLFNAQGVTGIINYYNLSTQSHGFFDVSDTSYSGSGQYNSVAFGPYFCFLDSNNNIEQYDYNGTEVQIIDTTTYPTYAQIQGPGLLLFNYRGNLFVVNPEKNLACAFNLTNKTISPIFPLQIDPSEGTPFTVGFDQDTGIAYVNVAGSSTPNLFANLSPMAF